MTQDQTASGSDTNKTHQKAVAPTYYGLLGLHPSASVREIRQAYRDLSKLYHPDTTNLSAAIATAKFQQLNEAYATLSNPERRLAYDQKIGYSRVTVVQPLPGLNRSSAQAKYDPSASAYLDPTDRPLSAGEIFALFILGVTFLACLTLAIAIGITRGGSDSQLTTAKTSPVQAENVVKPHPPAVNAALPSKAPALKSPPIVASPSPLRLDAGRAPELPDAPRPRPIAIPVNPSGVEKTLLRPKTDRLLELKTIESDAALPSAPAVSSPKKLPATSLDSPLSPQSETVLPLPPPDRLHDTSSL